MSRKCDLSGKGPLYGNSVSHSHKKTRRRWVPNLQKKKFYDEVTGEWITLKVTTRMIRTIDKKGVHKVLKEHGLVK